MATQQASPLSQALMGAGLSTGHPYAMAGAVGMQALAHYLNRGERKRQQKLQQVMAKWAPYTNNPMGGLQPAMAARPGLPGLLSAMPMGARMAQAEQNRMRRQALQDLYADRVQKKVKGGGELTDQEANYASGGAMPAAESPAISYQAPQSLGSMWRNRGGWA